jgi:CRP-like cAMP-binding protein
MFIVLICEGILLQLTFVNFKKGSYLLVDGKVSINNFYIIKQGQVRGSMAIEVPGFPSVTLGPGDFVGVISCMSGQSQIESVEALTDVVAILVRKEQYPELIANNTQVALKIIHNFANRMRSLNEVLTQLTQNDIAQTTPEQLFTVAEFYYKMKQLNVAAFGFYQYLKTCSTGKYIEQAKQRFIALKPKAKAVYLDESPDTLRNYPSGTMIFCECQIGHDMFIIQEGQVKITKIVNDNEVILAVLKKGEFFGEMALLENKPRSASAIAFSDCRVMVVNRSNFDNMVQNQPQLIARLTMTLSERLWSMHRNLINTQIVDPVLKLLDMLAIQIEKLKVPLMPKMQHQFDISPYDLANMCGIPKEKQALYVPSFVQNSHIKIINNKIMVTDCEDLVKVTSYYRQKNAK